MKRLWLKTAAILEDVIKQNPNNAVALTNLGAIYSNLARYKEALDLLKKARKLNFSDRNLYYNMGIVSVNLMQNREAKKYFTISSTLEANEWTFTAYIDFQAL
jgi:tetratricopeptide (TPR) repeat protein